MSDPLAADALSSLLVSLCCRVNGGGDDDVAAASSSYTATMSRPIAVIALVAHAIHTAVGFRLTRPASIADPASDDPLVRNKLKQDWIQARADDESFAFSYRHPQSSLLFELRVHCLGKRVVANAVAVEDNKTATVDIVDSDYISHSSLPIKITDSFSLKTVFNSPARLKDFVSLYKLQIIQKLVPGLSKPGYEEDRSTDSGEVAPPPAAGPSGTQPEPHRPTPDRGIGAAPRMPGIGGSNNPLEIGRSDLDPLGGVMGRMPGAGGDGMYVGPNHPLFSREREQNDPLRIPGTGNRGPWGGDGFLPPLGAPPGARFDPVGPFGPGTERWNEPRRNFGDEMPPPVRSSTFVTDQPLNTFTQGFANEGGLPPFNPNRGGMGGGFGPSRGGGFGNMFM